MHVKILVFYKQKFYIEARTILLVEILLLSDGGLLMRYTFNTCMTKGVTKKKSGRDGQRFNVVCSVEEGDPSKQLLTLSLHVDCCAMHFVIQNIIIMGNPFFVCFLDFNNVCQRKRCMDGLLYAHIMFTFQC